MCENGLIIKLNVKVNVKIHDVTHWITNNYNTLPGILKSKGDRAMKFDQLIEYNMRNVFLQKSCKNEAGRLVPDLFLFFEKTLNGVKASG